jgi:hypothetical protein
VPAQSNALLALSKPTTAFEPILTKATNGRPTLGLAPVRSLLQEPQPHRKILMARAGKSFADNAAPNGFTLAATLRNNQVQSKRPAELVRAKQWRSLPGPETAARLPPPTPTTG